MFNSERLIAGGCYPMKDGSGSRLAQKRWSAFQAGDTNRACNDEGVAAEWFLLCGTASQKKKPYLTECMLPVKIMGTLLVLLTIDDDLFS